MQNVCIGRMVWVRTTKADGCISSCWSEWLQSGGLDALSSSKHRAALITSAAQRTGRRGGLKSAGWAMGHMFLLAMQDWGKLLLTAAQESAYLLLVL